MPGPTHFARPALLVAVLTGASACATAQARTAPPPAPPALDVPMPPPRVVIPVTVRVPEPPPEPIATDPARPPAAGSTPPARPPDRPTTPPGQPPPTPVLQPTSNTAAIAQKARELIATARRDLARVDRARLTENARDQYDTAVRFIRMADDALVAKNFLYAQQLAESAAALAGALVKGAAPASAP